MSTIVNDRAVSLSEEIDWAVSHDQASRARRLARQLRIHLEELPEPQRTLGLVQYESYLRLSRRRKPDTRARKGDRHRKDRKRLSRPDRPYREPGQRDWETLGITAVDGEGWGSEDDVRQDYRLLVAVHIDGAGRYQWRLHLGDGSRRLHTLEILDWLCRLPRAGHVVGFSLGYDFAMWLRDVPAELLDRLIHRPTVRSKPVRWQYGPSEDCDWYDLDLLPGKSLTITRPLIGCTSGIRGTVRRTIWDAFSWHQSSFLALVERSPRISDEMRAVIRAGKESRGDEVKPVRQQLDYASTECLALAFEQRSLYGLCRQAGYELARYDGPGALAAQMLSQHGVMAHAGDPLPAAMFQPVMCGYFGGRFENALLGIVPELHQYDLRSAYPWAATELRSLVGARWEPVGHWLPGAEGLYHVRWSYPAHPQRLHPFPWRAKDQTICWPHQGESWVWHPELIAATAGGWNFEVLEGWQLHRASDDQPFQWLAEVYDRRLELKAAGDPTERVLKLGPNSVYGKLIQAVGAAPFQHLVWGSLITSAVRARLIEVIAQAPPGAVVVTATDGLYSLLPLDIEDSGLGSWEHVGNYQNVLISGSGFMEAAEMDSRTRGMRKVDAPFELLRSKWHAQLREWRRDGVEPWGPLVKLPAVEVTMRTFVGIALGLLWNKPELIGAWIEQKRMAAFGADKSPWIWGFYKACKEIRVLDKAVWIGAGAWDGSIYPYDAAVAREQFAEERAASTDAKDPL